jgi:hypothetical protein
MPEELYGRVLCSLGWAFAYQAGGRLKHAKVRYSLLCFMSETYAVQWTVHTRCIEGTCCQLRIVSFTRTDTRDEGTIDHCLRNLKGKLFIS